MPCRTIWAIQIQHAIALCASCERIAVHNHVRRIRNLFNISHLQPSLLLLVLEIYQHQNKDFEESVQRT